MKMRVLLLALAQWAILIAAPVPAVAEGSGDAAAMAGRQLWVEGRQDEAVAAIRPLAEQGVPRAMAVLGFFHERGLGVAQDDALAVAWYEKAARAGSPIGIHNLARAHEMGELSLAMDKHKARALYEQAAALDYGPSLHNLARMMIYGEGGPLDAAVGQAYFERAVSLGYAEAIADLGYVLSTGDGLPADLPRARALYEVAAAHGIDWAERDYARMLELGQGGDSDPAAALVYYARAAGQGYALAGMDIAELIWANPQVFPDRNVEALAWCLWAEAQPSGEDGSDLDGLCAARMAGYADEEVAAAREMVAGF